MLPLGRHGGSSASHHRQQGAASKASRLGGRWAGTLSRCRRRVRCPDRCAHHHHRRRRHRFLLLLLLLLLQVPFLASSAGPFARAVPHVLLPPRQPRQPRCARPWGSEPEQFSVAAAGRPPSAPRAVQQREMPLLRRCLERPDRKGWVNPGGLAPLAGPVRPFSGHDAAKAAVPGGGAIRCFLLATTASESSSPRYVHMQTCRSSPPCWRTSEEELGCRRAH